jgi:hypothetical protein
VSSTRIAITIFFVIGFGRPVLAGWAGHTVEKPVESSVEKQLSPRAARTPDILKRITVGTSSVAVELRGAQPGALACIILRIVASQDDA